MNNQSWVIGVALAFLVLEGSGAEGQNIQKFKRKYFRMDPTATSADYFHGVMQVKMKPAYKLAFSGVLQSGNRQQQLLSPLKIKQVRSAVPAGLLHEANARLTKPFRHDLGLYQKIYFDPSYPVEDAINLLYNTGMVDIAEPVYVMHSFAVPNDSSVSLQYYLDIIHAYDAWDITTGDSTIVIGIPDSGVDIDHPDLVGNLFINKNDPVDGIDNDNNGYIDDWRGWDFAGAFQNNQTGGDNDPSINKGGDFTHGTGVGGVAGAVGNNKIGVSGIAQHCRLLFTKHFADDQPTTTTSYASDPFVGVLYCAMMHANIINCSWGTPYQNQIYQDYIDVITQDMGILMVAAAGNTGIEQDIFPGAYRNVLSVSAVDQNLKKTSFTTYGKNVDITAPGSGIYVPEYNDTYAFNSGTSYSSPMVAGAAALVKSVYPDLTGYQAGELLRVTANDTIYEVNSSITFKNKLGKGLLDIKKALTDHPPDIRLIQYKLQNAEGKTPKLGEDAFLVATFQNFLWPSSGGLQVKLTSKSALFNVSGSTSDLGIIGTNQVITNASNPFKVKIQDNIPENLSVDLLFEFFDGAYYDYQFTSILLNPTFLNVEENQISSTIAENGRIGYQDTAQAEGLGTVFDGKNLLFEMGLMLGTSNTKISDAVRSIDNTYDHDFVSQERIKETSPGDLSQSEISGTFNDDSAISSKSNVLVRFRTMVWKGDPNNHYFIIQYNIKNNNLSPLNNFYAGLYADWDISNKGQSDRADWDSLYRIGYIYSLDTSRLYYAGIQILSGPPDYYAIDNDSANAGPNSFGVYDGFTDKEKFESLSSGIGRKQAGFALDSGADVSHTVASGPYVINPGDSITVAFAIHATKTLQDLLASVAAADTMYNYTLMATPPVCPNDTLCWNDQSTLIASGASKFNWYTDKSGGNPAYTGDSLSLNQVDHDTLVYVSTADHSWESVRVPVQVTVKANPTISVSGSTTLCNLDTVTLMVQPADSYLWNPGNETTQSIYVTDSGNFSVEVKDNALGCDSHSPVVKVIKNPSPVAGFTSDIQQFMINQPTHVTFSDQSVNPSSWFWLLSDGQTSTLQNPDFTINSASDIGVTLTVTSSNGCQGKDTQVLTVTGLDPFPSGLAKVYPNPSNGQLNISADNPATSIKKIELMNTSGKIVLERFIPGNSEPGLSMISTDGLQPGIYILRILMNNQRVVTYKIIIN